jgi:hypothetical protein
MTTRQTTTPPDVLARLQAAWQTPAAPPPPTVVPTLDRELGRAACACPPPGDSAQTLDPSEIKRRALEEAMRRSSLRNAA